VILDKRHAMAIDRENMANTSVFTELLHPDSEQMVADAFFIFITHVTAKVKKYTNFTLNKKLMKYNLNIISKFRNIIPNNKKK